MELHTFGDASTKGYGPCVYLRSVNAASKVHVTLISSKARVTPVKSITIPRLELQAAHGAVTLTQNVINELHLLNAQTYYYTDSEAVLGYITNTEARFPTFVANRVERIRDHSKSEQWFHVPTDINPADHASRGLNPCRLQSCNWFTGPEFLWNEPIKLPRQPKRQISSSDRD
ncbi:uncharacterized protein [Watersipora subatra]|uniref:uncharacterized protein n=1 Tax=Watersipora subatra TaxID=2589382 RepID=UPI00355BDF7B